MKDCKINWKKVLVILLAAAVLCGSDNVSIVTKAVQENGEQIQNLSGTARTEVTKLWVHCRAGGITWAPNMDVSDEHMRSVIDFNVLYGGSADELVQDSYRIQWIQEDGTVISGAPKNAGKYTVKVILDQSLAETAEMVEGKDSFTYTIRKLSLTNAIIGLYGEKMPEWTGEPVLPTKPYLANSIYRLPEDSYELQFVEGKNCVEPGMGYVKAIGTGPNVEGEKEFSYQISKARIDLAPIQEAVQKEFVYDGMGKRPILEEPLEGIQEIQYGNYHDSNFNKLEGIPKDAGDYKCFIQLIPEDSAHYRNGTWYQDYTIEPRKLEAEVQVVKSRVYDTSTGVKTPETTVKNLVQGDEAALSARAEYDTKQAGKNKTISISFALSGKDAANYAPPDDFVLTDGEITPKEVQAENIVLQSYYYNGSREVPLDDTAITDKNHWVLTGAYSSVDDVALDKSQVRAFMEDADVGEQKTVTFTGLKLTGADSSNYSLEQPRTAVTIRKILFSNAVWVELPDYLYGSTVPEPSLPRYKGNGEITYKFRKAGSEEEYQEWKEIDSQTLMPGKYEIIAQVTDTVNFEGGTTVYPKEFYVNWLSPKLTGTQSWEKTYGDAPFYLDAEHKGDGQLRYQVSQGEDILSVDADGKVTVKKPGEAVIQVIFDKTDFYRADSISVKISVSKAAGRASVSQEGWVYHPKNSNAKLPVPVSETNGTDCVTYQYKPKGAKDDAYTTELPVNAGEYIVKAAFAETENYQEVSAEAEFTIKKAQAQITGLNCHLKRYGDAPFALNLSKVGEGNLTYEVASGSEVVKIGEDGMVTIQKAGPAHVIVSMAATQNYEAAANTEVQIIISRGQGKAGVKLQDWEYSPDNANAKQPVPESETNGISHVSYLYKERNAKDDTYTEELPVNAGEYTVKAIFAETENYLETEAETDFQIFKKKSPENIPVGESAKINAGKTMNHVKELSLPEGWFWNDPDMELVPGGIVTVLAVYGDNDNYEQYQAEIKISKGVEIIESATDQEYIIGEDHSAVVKCTGALAELKSVETDGVSVDVSSYRLEEGSTILTFQKDYLDTLSVGSHKIRLIYTAGEVETVLQVKKKEGGGDNQDPGSQEPDNKPDTNEPDQNKPDWMEPDDSKLDIDWPEDNEPDNQEPKLPKSDTTPKSQILVSQASDSQTPYSPANGADSCNGTETVKRTETGDSSPLGWYVLLLFSSAAAAVYFVKKRAGRTGTQR